MRALSSFFDSMTETPRILYSIAESRGLSRPMTAAKLPRAFWSTSEEAIHKSHDPGIGESRQIESAILVIGLKQQAKWRFKEDQLTERKLNREARDTPTKKGIGEDSLDLPKSAQTEFQIITKRSD